MQQGGPRAASELAVPIAYRYLAMAFVLLLMLVLLLATPPGNSGAQAGLQFHAPTLVGPGSGYASNFEAISPTVFIGSSLHDYISSSGGRAQRATRNADAPAR